MTRAIGYKMAGREDAVTALQDIHLAPDSEYYPIRRYVGQPSARSPSGIGAPPPALTSPSASTLRRCPRAAAASL